MVKKLVSKLLFASAALWMVSGTASAGVISCSSDTLPANELSMKVSGTSACQVLTPLNSQQNDTAALVNAEGFFGVTNWVFDGKYETAGGSSTGNDSSALFSFTGGGQSGNYAFEGVNSAYDSLMFVFKDGNDTNLVAYLLNMPTSTGVYSSPFINPPFDVNNARDVSHISVYYVADEGGGGTGIPEPGTTAVIGLGLLGMGLLANRRKNRQS